MTARGVIDTLYATYGFIRGDDRIQRFFIPSSLQTTQRIGWDDLHVGMVVEFIGIEHPRGPRAIEVLILEGGHDAVEHTV